MDPNSPEILTSKRFIMQGSYLIQMLNTALNMLGPDIELLTDILQDLGAKHVRYGVKPAMFGIMGDALIKTLEELLGSKVFNDNCKAAWKETYAELSSDMIKAMKK
jgi:methyl-accepting chemotaxis protein